MAAQLSEPLMDARTASPPNVRVVVFSSHVARGSVGNRAIVFALETLGFEVWAVPTVQLPWHPGHGPGTRIPTSSEDFAALVSDLEATLDVERPVAVISGYLGHEAQAQPIARFVNIARKKGALVRYLCDPVMGDHGGLYIPKDVAQAIREALVPLADIVTPNRFELGWLVGGGEAADMSQTIAQAKSLGASQVLATSAPALMAHAIGNVLVSQNGTFSAEHRSIDPVPNGTGDLFAALYLAHVLFGRQPSDALAAAAGSVYALAGRAARTASPDFHLPRDQDLLRRASPVPVRQMMTTKA